MNYIVDIVRSIKLFILKLFTRNKMDNGKDYIFKPFEETFNQIGKILSIRNIENPTCDLFQNCCEVEKSDNHFVAKVITQDHDLYKKVMAGNPQFEFGVEGEKYFVQQNGWRILSCNDFLAQTLHVEIELSSIVKTGNHVKLEELKNWRYLTPISKNGYDAMFLYMASICFKTETTREYPGIITLSTHYGEIHVGYVSYANKKWLFIEPQYECGITDIGNISLAVISSLGFITGKVQLDESYIIGYADNSFKSPIYLSYQSLQKSFDYPYYWYTDNNFNIVTTTWEKYRAINEDIHQRLINFVSYYEHTRTKGWLFPTEVISKLIDLMLDDDDKQQLVLSAAFELLSSIHYNLEMQPAVCSVAMEGLTKRLMKIEGWNPPQDIDEELWKDIESRLTLCINDFYKGEKITKNQCVNLISYIRKKREPSNNQKLRYGFQLYGYELNKEEKEILEMRNVVLHGTPAVKQQDLNSMSKEYLKIVVTFHFLFSVLILNHVGYKGKVLNHKKWYCDYGYRHLFVEIKGKAKNRYHKYK